MSSHHKLLISIVQHYMKLLFYSKQYLQTTYALYQYLKLQTNKAMGVLVGVVLCKGLLVQ